LIENTQAFIELEAAIGDAEKEKSSIARRLSFSLFTAPEWSSVGMDGPRVLGYKYGAKIGCRLNKHLELGIELFLSQKKFNGTGAQFAISDGWIDDIMPMIMDTKCNIIEISLDLNYHFSGVGNTGFVRGVGLRSFMLHSEWYGFEYDPNQDNNPNLLRDKNMANQNGKRLSLLSIAFLQIVF